MHIRTTSVLAAVAITLLTACSSEGGVALTPTADSGVTPAPSSAVPPAASLPAQSPSPARAAVEPFVAKGRVADAAGRALEGAEVFADYRLIDDFALEGTTDAQGDYRLELSPPESSWHMSAQFATTYHGIEYRFSLHPPRRVAGMMC